MAECASMLPAKAVELLKLEGLVAVECTNPEVKELEFAGIDTVTIHYQATPVKSDHYLLQDDPYSVSKGDVSGAGLRLPVPDGATHYCIGKWESEEGVSSGKNRYAWYKDKAPVAFFRKRGD